MPILGTGVVPSGDIANELSALTRRAFIPKVVVQFYYSTPTAMLLMGNAQKAAGGLSQITQPVQGASMVQGAWTGYSGTFTKPSVIPGVKNAEWNLAFYTVPVPLVMGEALIQSTEAILPILDVRMNDVYAVTAQQVSSAIFSNNSANNLMPQGFVEAFDNGGRVANYGGISRIAAGNQYWQGQYYDAGGANILVMSPSDFATLNTSFIGTEVMNLDPGKTGDMDTALRSSFPNLEINGIRIYMDHWCPKGTIYAINSKYTALYMSEDAAWAFSGFYSTVPQLQIGQVGVMILGYNIITSKPSSGAIITNFTGGAF
jgi:hypothetical protein